MAALPQLVSPTVQAIEAAVSAAHVQRQDLVVRASAIGRPCERHLWYRFRWAHEPETFEPRILRLFESGHIEEARMVGWLDAAGIDVAAVDPATGEQWEVSALAGHFKGHLDGVVLGVVEAPKSAHLLECKTHNAKSFSQLVKHGVAVSKPEHLAQMQVYMHLQGLTRALYLAKNKDTDELHAERVDYDAAQALALLAKAERVIGAQTPPGRISENPDFFTCRFCSSRGVCHENDFESAMVLRSCRTCLHATPAMDGDARWHCTRHNIHALTLEQQAEGCPNHLYLPGLVPGEQLDFDDQAEWIDYRLADGTIWRDGGMVSEAAQ